MSLTLTSDLCILTDVSASASLRSRHTLFVDGDWDLGYYFIIMQHYYYIRHSTTLLDYHKQLQQDRHVPSMSLSMLSGYVTSCPKYSVRCLDVTFFLRLLYSASPSTTGTLSLNNFLKSKYVLIRRHALEIGALRRNRYVPQMGMYLLVRSHCISWTCTHAVRVQRNQVLHRPNMIEGGHRIHFGIPTMMMGVMKLLMALPPTGIPA